MPTVVEMDLRATLAHPELLDPYRDTPLPTHQAKKLEALAKDRTDAINQIASGLLDDSTTHTARLKIRYSEVMSNYIITRHERSRSDYATLIRLARLRTNLSQAALAIRVGLSPGQISRYERGLCTPSTSTINKVIAVASL